MRSLFYVIYQHFSTEGTFYINSETLLDFRIKWICVLLTITEWYSAYIIRTDARKYVQNFGILNYFWILLL
jgi:hypothetical protein